LYYVIWKSFKDRGASVFRLPSVGRVSQSGCKGTAFFLPRKCFEEKKWGLIANLLIIEKIFFKIKKKRNKFSFFILSISVQIGNQE
jgi:hypothetical protein